MAFRNLLFWISRPPDTDPEHMTLTMWNSFRDSIGGILALWVLIGVIIAVIGYALHVRRRRITHPTHYFASYTPLRWPWLIAVLPAVIIAWQYYVEYKRLFPATLLSPVGGAVAAAFEAWLLSWLISRIVVMLAGITPRKFRFRPIPWRPSRPARAVEVAR
jgi:Zn-dependent protease with chaperone function